MVNNGQKVTLRGRSKIPSFILFVYGCKEKKKERKKMLFDDRAI